MTAARRSHPIARLRDARGTAALEFALVMPFVLTLFLACIDVGRLLSWVEQARRAAIASADAASVSLSLSNAVFLSIMQGEVTQATSAVWSSNTTANGLILTVIRSDSNGALTIAMQSKYPPTFTGTSAYGCHAGSTPTGLSGVNWEAYDTFIVSEVWLTYQPFSFAGNLLNSTGLQTSHDQFVFRPRQPPVFDPNSTGTC